MRKTKRIYFRVIGLHLKCLTRTNLESKGSFQAKEDTFFLDFWVIWKKKKIIFPTLEEKQHPKKTGRTFCLDSYLVHPWQWWVWLGWFKSKNIHNDDIWRLLLSVTWMNVFIVVFLTSIFEFSELLEGS